MAVNYIAGSDQGSTPVPTSGGPSKRRRKKQDKKANNGRGLRYGNRGAAEEVEDVGGARRPPRNACGASGRRSLWTRRRVPAHAVRPTFARGRRYWNRPFLWSGTADAAEPDSRQAARPEASFVHR